MNEVDFFIEVCEIATKNYGKTERFISDKGGNFTNMESLAFILNVVCISLTNMPDELEDAFMRHVRRMLDFIEEGVMEY